MSRDIADIGFNGRIVYVSIDPITEYGRISFPEYSDTPTGDDDERTVYISRSAEICTAADDLVRESNYYSLKRDAGDGVFIDVSHAYGDVLALDITGRASDESVRMWLDVLIRLDDEYPLYDESDYSEREYNAWNSAVKDEISPHDVDSEDDLAAILDLFYFEYSDCDTCTFNPEDAYSPDVAVHYETARNRYYDERAHDILTAQIPGQTTLNV